MLSSVAVIWVMASPEYPTDPAAALADISRKLELADEIENPVERTFKRDALLEQFDELQAEIGETPSPTQKQV